jgi:Family of unknown function (DUF5335)
VSVEEVNGMQVTRQLVRDAWSEYLDAVSAELVNAPVTIEVITDSEPPRLEARRMALLAVGYDRRDDVFEIAVARGGAHLPGVLRHLVDHPRRIEADSHTLLAPMTIAVDGRDGLRTVITIESEPEFTG